MSFYCIVSHSFYLKRWFFPLGRVNLISITNFSNDHWGRIDWFGFGLVLAVLPGASTRHEQISWCWNISALVKQVCIADQFVELVFSLLQPQKPPVGFEPGTSCFVIHYNPCNYTRTAGEPPHSRTQLRNTTYRPWRASSVGESTTEWNL